MTETMTSTPQRSRGVITLGFGAKRYQDMAKTLLKNIRIRSPRTQTAVVSETQQGWEGLADFVIPLKPEYGEGFLQKIHLDYYSPFDDTIFIDSDCLVVDDLEYLWDKFAGYNFTVCGTEMFEGQWFRGDIGVARQRLGIEGPVPKFNGGFMYWSRGNVSANVFSGARELEPRYHELGFHGIRGYGDPTVTDEILVSLSMALVGEKPMDDQGTVMRTPIGLEGNLKVDVLRGHVRFIKNGVPVSPSIVHFAGGFSRRRVYLRESLKVAAAWRAPRLLRFPLVAFVDVADLASRAPARLVRPLRRMH